MQSTIINTHADTNSREFRLWILNAMLVSGPNSLDSVIDRISFHSVEAGTVDHFDDLLFGHFYFAAGLDGVAVGELAAVGDGAVEIISSVMQCCLRGGFAEHDPVGLYVVEVVEHQA